MKIYTVGPVIDVTNVVDVTICPYVPCITGITCVRRIISVGIDDIIAVVVDVDDTGQRHTPRVVGKFRERRISPVGIVDTVVIDDDVARRGDRPSEASTKRDRRSNYKKDSPR